MRWGARLGTTVTVLLLAGGRDYLLHVGDCRVYRITAAPPDDAQGAPARMALDPDALRAQVRDVVRRPEAASTMLAPGPAPEHVAGALDRPRLDALARRVGRPPQVAGERRQPDGSWHIRFAGGVCTRIPRDMPAQLGNAFGENIALPSTCTD